MKASHVGIGLIGAGLLAAAAAFLRRPRSSARASGPMLLLGDSLAVGLSGPFKSLGLPMQSIAIEGTTTEYWTTTGRARLATALTPSIGTVLVSLGTNDAYAGESYAPRALASTHQLLSTLIGAGAQVLWIGPPKLPSSYGSKLLSQGTLDTIRQVVEATDGALWLDHGNTNLPRQSDQLHPTQAGYLAWANLLVDELAQFFVSPGPTDMSNSLGDDTEPSPIPPPPSVVPIPPGWDRLKNASRPMMVFALSVLAERRPIGDLKLGTVDGREVAALTEWHWDNHVDRTWKWHRGISLLVPLK